MGPSLGPFLPLVKFPGSSTQGSPLCNSTHHLIHQVEPPHLSLEQRYRAAQHQPSGVPGCGKMWVGGCHGTRPTLEQRCLISPAPPCHLVSCHSQPCSGKRQADRLAPSTHPSLSPRPTKEPHLSKAMPARGHVSQPGLDSVQLGMSLTTLDVEGAGVIQPVQLVMAARLGLPCVGKASTRGLHQPAGRLEIITFQAIEVPAEA